MKKIHFECSMGAAGDMLLGALVDAGADPEYIISGLQSLDVDGWELSFDRVVRSGIASTYASVIEKQGNDHHHDPSGEHLHESDVKPHHHHHHGDHRHLKDMLALVRKAAFPASVCTNAEKVFRLLAEAEGKIHGKSPDEVHFHEVSGIDTIVDTFGVCLAFENLGISSASASAIHVGRGTVQCAHGLMPVPAPATQEIMAMCGIPYATGPIDKELLTPTGAALLGVLCDDFSPLPEAVPVAVGYGAGTADFKGHANVVRAIICDVEKSNSNAVIEMRASVDDVTGEEMGHVLELLYAAGVLEAYCLPAVMKKGRPGCELVVLAAPGDRGKIEQIIFSEGITLGMRVREVNRTVLDRRKLSRDVLGHNIRIKEGLYEGHVVSRKAEYEDCRTVALETGRPLREVRRLAEE